MTRLRLRPTPTPAELERLYAQPHQHTRFADHLLRVDVTTAMATQLLGDLTPAVQVVADLSCGDASIAYRLAAQQPLRLILGDLAPGYPICGPIEQTIEQLDADSVDLFICSETLEHLDDPDEVLAQIRKRTNRLILSTPAGENDQRNPEHVWGWDTPDVRDMLQAAGFVPLICNLLDLRPAGFQYAFQIWSCI